MAKERSSNLELLRILCCIFIIADHFTYQSGIIEGNNLGSSFFYCAEMSLARVSCSVFIIISAWFSVESKFKFKKIIHIWLVVIMYTVPISLYLLHAGEITRDDMVIALFPLEESPLWFASYYMVLVFLSPFLNFLIKNAPRYLVKYFFAFMLVFLVAYPTLTTRLGFFHHEIWILIFLYLLTGYIKHYKVTMPGTATSFTIFSALWGGITFARAIVMRYYDVNPVLMFYIGNFCETYRVKLQTLPNLIMAYCIFFGFNNLKIRNCKLVNRIASASLGVYVYHQVPHWYEYMWTHIYHSDVASQSLHGCKRMLYTVCCIITVWLIGVCMELLRIRIAALLVESRKPCQKLCHIIDAFVNNETRSEQDRWTIIGAAIIVSVYMIVIYAYTQGAFS